MCSLQRWKVTAVTTPVGSSPSAGNVISASRMTKCIYIRKIWDKALNRSTEQCVCAICLEAIDRLQKGNVPKA